MKYKIHAEDIQGVSQNYILLHPSTAEQIGISPGTLLVSDTGKYGFRLITNGNIEQGIAAISSTKIKEYNIKEGEEINLTPSGEEGVTRIIRRKMAKRTLTEQEIETFMSSLNSGLLTNSHVAAFGTAVEINGMQEKEIVAVAKSVINHSKQWSFPGKTVVDKHSIGGIAGNRITPLMIPILAASGLCVPKISTRAITSPAGTIDALEVVTNPNLTSEEATDVIDKTNACMVNGATVGLGSVMDKFLSSVKQVKVDPREMMIASILAKKKAAGSEFVIIDLPTGKGSKLPSKEDARRLAYDFSGVGNKIGLKVECVISPGDKPVGAYIGPSLEMTEVMRILENGQGSLSLKRKALSISGLIFETMHMADRGSGMNFAREVLEAGKAHTKFLEIIEAQGGDPDITADDIEEAPYSHTITADRGDIVYSIDSYNVGLMARAAGCPNDKKAGVILHVDRGDELRQGDPIIEIRSHSEGKLSEAISMMKTSPPIVLEKSVLEHITGIQGSE